MSARVATMRSRTYAAIAVAALVATGCGGKGTTIIVTSPTATVTQQPLSGQVYRVPSGSMEPTLGIGARVVVQPRSPQVGDIVVFHPPEGAEEEVCGPTAHVMKLGGEACSEPVPKEASVKFIKRIVAGPGDEIYIREGHVYRKAAGTSQFVAEQDSYIKPCGTSPECDFPTPIKIPAGDWFTLGDNRGESDDSRFWGPVPTAWIEGVVTVNTPAGSPE